MAKSNEQLEDILDDLSVIKNNYCCPLKLQRA